jgi:hypothetical protein
MAPPSSSPSSIDIETCQACGGPVRIVACIDDPMVIPKALATLAGQARKKILDHLKRKGACQDAVRLPESHGPPQTTLFDKENPFVKHKAVAGNTGQGRRLIAGLVWADQSLTGGGGGCMV